MKTRNINDDSTLAYLFNKTRQGASDALQKAVETINNTITTITTNMPQWIKANINYVTGETIDDKIARLLSGDYLPRNKPFIGYVTSGSAYFTAGYLYLASNQLYGSFIFSSYKGSATIGGIYSVTAGVVEKRSVDRAGDTMTGYLTFKNTGTAVGDIPSSQVANGITVTDKNGTETGFVNGGFDTSGNVFQQIGTERVVGGATKWHHVRQAIASDGTATVTFGQVAAWRSALGLGTSGALPITIAQGGTGQTGVTSTSTITDLITAATGVTISACRITKWGKVAMIRIVLQKSTAFTNTSTLIATLKRAADKPPYEAGLIAQSANMGLCYMSSSGEIYVAGTYSANTNLTIEGTYILA